MTDIKQRLKSAHAGLDPVDLVRWCRDALAEIERLEGRGMERKLNERYDRFLAAALQGILARSTAGDLMTGPAALIKQAKWIAEMCIQAQSGEDS